MTSDNRGDKAKGVLEKAEKLNEKLGPEFRARTPKYLSNIKDWTKDYGPDVVHEIVAQDSRVAAFNKTRFGTQLAH